MKPTHEEQIKLGQEAFGRFVDAAFDFLRERNAYEAVIITAANRLRYLADNAPNDELPPNLHALARELEDTL